MIGDLYSPGTMTSERAALELRLDHRAEHALPRFLAQVTRDALDSSSSFTFGEVQSQWDRVVTSMAKVMAEFLDRPAPDLNRPDLSHDEHLHAMVRRLRAVSLPSEVYQSARAVLMDGGGRKEMRTALSPDTGMTELTASLGTFGMSWRSLTSLYSRIEATIGFNVEVIRQAFLRDVNELLWVAHHDERTRPTHLAADGQRARPGGHYLVGKSVLRYPGDPAGLAEETIQCRCVLSALV